MEHFAYIPYVADKQDVMRRMGAQRAQLPGDLEYDIDTLFEYAQMAFRVRGKALCVPIEHAGEGLTRIGGEAVLSAQLARLLGSSASAYLMCTTIPARDVEKIHDAMQRGEGLKALVLDAYASECVDGALGVIINRKNEALRHLGRKLTKHRFSAGYGDLDIKYQKLFYGLLKMHTLGVDLNGKYLLSPEKSVIAIAGVEG